MAGFALGSTYTVLVAQNEKGPREKLSLQFVRPWASIASLQSYLIWYWMSSCCFLPGKSPLCR